MCVCEVSTEREVQREVVMERLSWSTASPADRLVLTLSTPVYGTDVGNQQKLVGVAAIDLTLADALAGVEYFRSGELSYAFVINDDGQCLFLIVSS